MAARLVQHATSLPRGEHTKSPINLKKNSLLSNPRILEQSLSLKSRKHVSQPNVDGDNCPNPWRQIKTRLCFKRTMSVLNSGSSMTSSHGIPQ